MILVEGRSLLAAFDGALADRLHAHYHGDDAISQGVRYVLDAGGKRVRPLLCLMSADAVADEGSTGYKQALPAALALEFIHTYSLVHDDLPCMDDDDMRRGRPTAHKVYGDAQALLIGDALLTDAFTLLSDDSSLSAERRLAIVRELATAAGGAGMVLGQSLDLHWTARRGAGRQDLDDIHLRKTGYLLGAAAAAGAIAGGAKGPVVDKFREFGRLLGLAFQVLDDLLDESSATGKSVGKDKATGKLTYLALMSAAEAQEAAQAYTDQALAVLTGTGAAVDRLSAFARDLLSRHK